jgi:hypothetical protein
MIIILGCVGGGFESDVLLVVEGFMCFAKEVYKIQISSQMLHFDRT